MKSGIVLIPFVDGKTGTAYKINDDFKANKKRFDELLKAGLISDGNEVEEVSEEETEVTEEIQNEEPVEEESEEESVEPENGEEVSEEESDAE